MKVDFPPLDTSEYLAWKHRIRVRRITATIKVLVVLGLIAVFLVVGAIATGDGARQAGENIGTSRTWYFAEGTTRPGYTEYLCLLNPYDANTHVDITFFMADGERVSKSREIPARSRVTVNVSDEVPEGKDVSVRIKSDVPIVAERPVEFLYMDKWTGSHRAKGAIAPSSEWYFAEGCSRPGFDTYLCLFNPCGVGAEVDVTYYCADGEVVKKEGIEVTAGSRFTIPVHEDDFGVGRHAGDRGDFSIEVESVNGVGVVAERPMYFSYKPFWSGGNTVVGTNAPSKVWYFAEGCTRGEFDTFLCLANPSETDAEVDIRYFCADGEEIVREGIEVPGLSRVTIPVHEQSQGIGRWDGDRGNFSIMVESVNGVGVVAERPVHYSYKPCWTGGHDAMGALAAGNNWYFADACVRHGYDTYICLSNPNPEEALVNIDYYSADGSYATSEGIKVSGRGRVTIPVHEGDFGVGRNDNDRGDLSVKVESVNGVSVVAERVVYSAPKWRTMDRNILAAAWGWGERHKGDTRKKVVALTFDPENSKDVTASILDVLKKKDVQCTFFVPGFFAKQYPDLIKRMASEGHEVANQSTTHPMCTRVPAELLQLELAVADSIVLGQTGIPTKPYLRFPYGDRNAETIAQANSEGYLSVYWTIDTQDWMSHATGDSVYAAVMSQVGNGAIVLMHDKWTSLEALPRMIDDLRAAGYVPATVTEVLDPGPPQ